MLLSDVSVGDWIRTPDDEVTQVLELDAVFGTQNKLSNGHICFNGFLKACELWQPRKDEWCWFITKKTAPILARFVYRDSKTLWLDNEYKTILGYKADSFGHYSGNIGPQEEDYIFPYCQPFIGELPTYLKGL